MRSHQHHVRITGRGVAKSVIAASVAVQTAHERTGTVVSINREPFEAVRRYERERTEGTGAVRGIVLGLAAGAGIWALIGVCLLAIVR